MKLRDDLDIDLFANDPGRWSASLANNAELLFGSLEAAGVRSVAEVGAYAGDLTQLLLRWAAPFDGRVIAIDPDPKPPLVELEASNESLELIRATSHEALKTLELPDAVILDGDHNYFTVAGELRLIAERAGDEPLPLLLLHDVGWPHGRRDLYEAPDAIPESERRPMTEGGGLFPGEPGIRPGGLPMRASASREGGPRNGVLTAVEDFMADRSDLRLAIIPSFFGLGILWSLDAPYAGALAELLDPWDRNPLLQRLEDNRVLHLASSHWHMVQAGLAAHRDAEKTAFLEKLLHSRMFALASRLTALRERGTPAFSPAEVRRLLGR